MSKRLRTHWTCTRLVISFKVTPLSTPYLRCARVYGIHTDYRAQDTGKCMIATKNNLFRQLPPFLIICLKQYAYTEIGFEKIDKRIGFAATLDFKKNWLSAGHKPWRYRLVATCNHHGQGRGGVLSYPLSHFRDFIVVRVHGWMCVQVITTRPMWCRETGVGSTSMIRRSRGRV